MGAREDLLAAAKSLAADGQAVFSPAPRCTGRTDRGSGSHVAAIPQGYDPAAERVKDTMGRGGGGAGT